MEEKGKMIKIKINDKVYIIKAEGEEGEEGEEGKYVNNENLNDDLVDYFLNLNKHLFIFFYLDTCGPCKQTKPEWDKFNAIDDLNNNVIVMRINQKFKDEVTKNDNKIFNFESFPYFIYVKKGDGDELITEEYTGGRDINSFKNFIQEKSNPNTIGGKKCSKKSRRNKRNSRKSRRRRCKRSRRNKRH